MSLFKEKDDYIKKAFQDLFCKDSDSEDEEFQELPTAKKSKLEKHGKEEEEEPSTDDKGTLETIITIDDDDDDDDEVIEVGDEAVEVEEEVVEIEDDADDDANEHVDDEAHANEHVDDGVEKEQEEASWLPPVPTSTEALNEIKVKLQDGNLRHTKVFRICKDQTVDHLKNLYAKEFNIINLDSIKLWFDGELIDEGLTPEELDIDDDCVVDVMIHN